MDGGHECAIAESTMQKKNKGKPELKKNIYKKYERPQPQQQ
jgi:hypothetical protein